MIRILVDTNVLVYIFERKLNINEVLDRALSEAYILNTLDLCLNELKTIGKPGIVKFVAQIGIRIVNSGMKAISVDDAIIKEASLGGFYIMSEDKELLAKAAAEGIRTISFNGYGVKIN